ncbi:MAG: ImmA/IrrE family metallo-endopeptidase [Deltaproteobacteria bacterium]|nr:ImmA/IrrE family metallo-endopeptidase [Deltaproteobacteria bacterium]
MGIGSRIKAARIMAGLNLRHLADEVGVSAQAISKYERELDVPGSGKLIKLAKSLNVTIEYFLRPTEVHLSAPYYRRSSSLSKTKEKSILARVQDCIERYMEVEQLFGSIKSFIIPQSLNTHINSLDEVERVAEDLRGEWQLGLDPIENLVAILEDHGVRVVVLEGDDHFDALTQWANGYLPVIAVKSNIPGDRQRLNLGHELGHIILNVGRECDIEKAAYRFSGAFLVPRDAALFELGKKRRKIDLLEVHILKHKYGLSKQGWVYRAKDLEIITESQAANLFKLFRQKDWRKREPGDQLPPEEPKRMDRLLMRALAERIISESRASELLGMQLPQYLKKEAQKHGGFPSGMCN